jgi:hypothetical protein
MDIYGKPNIGLVRYSSRKRKEKGRPPEKDQEAGTRKDKIAGGCRGR